MVGMCYTHFINIPRGSGNHAARSNPNMQLGDSQRVVSMAAVVYCLYKFYDCPHNRGHKGVYLYVSLSMLNSNYYILTNLIAIIIK